MKIKDIGEIGLIKELAKRFRLDSSVIKGSGDDAAVVRWTKDKYLLLTCDMLIEGIHFSRPKASPFQIGWKALGRNLSDIAAMGGSPRYALVSLAIPESSPVSVAKGICDGIKSLADKFGVNIVGGDMARSRKIMIDISVAGEVRKKNLVLRSGAKVRDLILVTGSLGGSKKGKHLNFMPRIKESQSIVNNFKVNSMIDISDSLAIDLYRIIGPCNLGASIYEESIPLSRDAVKIEDALYDGEDYELLFTMGAKEAERLLKSNFARVGTRVSLIGEITDKRYGYKIIRESGHEEDLRIKGYTHF